MSRGPDYYRRVGNWLNEARQPETNVSELEQFLRNGVDVNVALAGTALHIACGARTKTNRLQVVQFLVSKGANVNALDHVQTPLHAACRNPKVELEVLRFMVESGAGLNECDLDERTPLFWATIFLPVDAVEYLCKMGANYDHADAGGFTPFHWACMKNRPKLIRLYLLQKAQFAPTKRQQLGFDSLNPDNKRMALAFISQICGRTGFWGERNQRIAKTKQFHDGILAEVQKGLENRGDILQTKMCEDALRMEIRCCRVRAEAGDRKLNTLASDFDFTRRALFTVAVQEDVIVLRRRKIEMRRKKYEDIFLAMRDDLAKVRNDFYAGLLGDHLMPAFAECESFRPEPGVFGQVRRARIMKPWRGRSHFAVVLKKMDTHLFSLRDFTRYITAVSQLNHPNVVKIYGWRMTREEFFMLEDFFPRTLKDYISDGDSTILSDLRLVHSIAKGMHYLHQKEMLHGNLKIHNVLLNDNDKAVLCDFWYRTEVKDENFNSSVKVFTAPEQILTSLFDNILKVDMYAFGILCYCIIFKKTEEDLFHRLHRKPVELVMFLHSNVIRPLLAKFPIELGIELRTEWRGILQRECAELKELHISSRGKKRREIFRKINEAIPRLLTLHPAKKTRAKAAEIIDEYKKSVRGRAKRLNPEDQMKSFRRGWDYRLRDYYDAMLLPKFKVQYMGKLNALESISKHDLPLFLDLLKELIPGCSAKTLEYFEVMWKDMLYVKEYLKKTPPEFVDLMKLCWDHDPTRRPENFLVVQKKLEACILSQLASARTMSPEEIQQSKIQCAKDTEGIRGEYRQLAEREIQNYAAIDENDYEIAANEDETECREKVLKKVNDELEKLMRLRSAVTGEIREIDQRYAACQQAMARMRSERDQFTAERQRLNDREKAVKQRLRDVMEQEKMASIEL